MDLARPPALVLRRPAPLDPSALARGDAGAIQEALILLPLLGTACGAPCGGGELEAEVDLKWGYGLGAGAPLRRPLKGCPREGVVIETAGRWAQDFYDHPHLGVLSF